MLIHVKFITGYEESFREGITLIACFLNDDFLNDSVLFLSNTLTDHKKKTMKMVTNLQMTIVRLVT